MIPCEPGDVFLVRFPFTDLTSTKRRPVVVVSSSEFSALHGDVVVLALTGNRQENGLLALEDWDEAGLLKPTSVKPLVATLASTVFVRRLGTLSEQDQRKVSTALKTIFARKFLSR